MKALNRIMRPVGCSLKQTHTLQLQRLKDLLRVTEGERGKENTTRVEEVRESNEEERKAHSLGAHVLEGINKKKEAVIFRDFTEILLAKQHGLF